MKTISKTLVGTVTAGAIALTSAAPSFARDRDGGISTGEIIAGAVILGGIAAIAASSGNRDHNYRGYDNTYGSDYNQNYGYNNDRYDRGNGRVAIERCVQAAENNARRAGYRYANVTQIRDLDNTRYGWRVKGQMDVQSGYGRYGNRNRDSGKFTCDLSRGRVVGLDYSGIRGLR